MLVRHHLATGLDFDGAVAAARSDLDQRVPGFDGDEAILCGVRTLLDLDRTEEAIEVYKGQVRDDNVNTWFSATARIVRTLMATDSEEALISSALKRAHEMAINDGVEGGPEVSLLIQIHLPGSVIPPGLVAYWAATSDPYFPGEWSMLEAAELLVWRGAAP